MMRMGLHRRPMRPTAYFWPGKENMSESASRCRRCQQLRQSCIHARCLPNDRTTRCASKYRPTAADIPEFPTLVISVHTWRYCLIPKAPHTETDSRLTPRPSQFSLLWHTPSALPSPPSALEGTPYSRLKLLFSRALPAGNASVHVLGPIPLHSIVMECTGVRLCIQRPPMGLKLVSDFRGFNTASAVDTPLQPEVAGSG
ncbi:hypothetical protein GY45DRAFT_346785 [Cubamyces sp. BRFM 1775]|nr:hypothetical protein GY45DRAFT_346785 [Cubamyces sp. BRFM 1775]